MNWAAENKRLLESKGHYPMQMTPKPGFWWFNLAQGKMTTLANASREQFCIVLIGDRNASDDYYVIPYAVAKKLLTEETLAKPAAKRPAPRWNMFLRGDRLGLWAEESVFGNQKPLIDVQRHHSCRTHLQRWSHGNSLSKKDSVDAGVNRDGRVGNGVVEKSSSGEWVSVAAWLDRCADIGLVPPDRYGVYRFRVGRAHREYAGRLLYIGSTQKSGKVGKGVDNFTGLRRRMWQFISSALGFGMAGNPGCRLGEHGLSARDLEASWAVVDCPSAHATLKTGVGKSGDFEETSLDKEASHEQEVYRPVVG
jgi:hypothetical protein